MKIVPTLIAKNQKELSFLFNKYKKYFKYFQIDIMDGTFVKNKSNWFDFKLPSGYKYEAHLMVDSPEKWVYKNYKKVDVIIANFEKVKDPMQLIEFIKSKNKRVGFAINPETPINDLEAYFKYLDLILILAVHPGKYGARFLSSSLKKVKILRKLYKKNIEIDGHEDPKHIRLLKKVGANSFAIGSYLKNNENISKAIKELKDALR